MNVEQIIKTEVKLPLAKRTMIHFNLIMNKIQEEVSAGLKPHDISLPQYNVLSILRGQKGKPANLSTINERMVSKMSNTTRLVDKLILKNYVSRNTCPHNRRKVEILITEEGLKNLKVLDGILIEIEERIFNQFSKDDLIELNKLLDKF